MIPGGTYAHSNSPDISFYKYCISLSLISDKHASIFFSSFDMLLHSPHGYVPARFLTPAQRRHQRLARQERFERRAQNDDTPPPGVPPPSPPGTPPPPPDDDDDDDPEYPLTDAFITMFHVRAFYQGMTVDVSDSDTFHDAWTQNGVLEIDHENNLNPYSMDELFQILEEHGATDEFDVHIFGYIKSDAQVFFANNSLGNIIYRVTNSGGDAMSLEVTQYTLSISKHDIQDATGHRVYDQVRNYINGFSKLILTPGWVENVYVPENNGCFYKAIRAHLPDPSFFDARLKTLNFVKRKITTGRQIKVLADFLSDEYQVSLCTYAVYKKRDRLILHNSTPHQKKIHIYTIDIRGHFFHPCVKELHAISCAEKIIRSGRDSLELLLRRYVDGNSTVSITPALPFDHVEHLNLAECLRECKTLSYNRNTNVRLKPRETEPSNLAFYDLECFRSPDAKLHDTPYMAGFGWTRKRQDLEILTQEWLSGKHNDNQYFAKFKGACALRQTSGPNCLQEMLSTLLIHCKSNDISNIRVYGFNSARYDNFILLCSVKFSSCGWAIENFINDPNQGIILLALSREGVVLEFRDFRQHHAGGSLDSLLKGFNAPKQMEKRSFDHDKVYGWITATLATDEISEYLDADTLAIPFLLSCTNIYRKSYCNKSIYNYMSASSMAYAHLYQTTQLTTYVYPHPQMRTILEKYHHGPIVNTFELQSDFFTHCTPRDAVISINPHEAYCSLLANSMIEGNFPNWIASKFDTETVTRREILSQLLCCQTEIPHCDNITAEINAALKKVASEPPPKDHILELDANSLYPTTMALFPMPTGKARAVTGTEATHLIGLLSLKSHREKPSVIFEWYGVFRCDLYPPDNACMLRQSCVPSHFAGRLDWTFRKQKNVWQSNFTLYIALKQNWKLVLHEGVIWESSLTCSNFVITLYNKRKQLKEIVKKSLDPTEKIRASNEEQTIKLILNGCYGKTKKKSFAKSNQIVPINNIPSTHNVRAILHDTHAYVSGPPGVFFYSTHAIGNAILDGARCFMFLKDLKLDLLNRTFDMPPRLIYRDTDSSYLLNICLEEMKNLGYLGTELGQFKNDTPEGGKIMCMMAPAKKLKYMLIKKPDGTYCTTFTSKGLGKLELGQTELDRFNRFQKLVKGEDTEFHVTYTRKALKGNNPGLRLWCKLTKVFKGSRCLNARKVNSNSVGPLL